jgi:hypothetical protein
VVVDLGKTEIREREIPELLEGFLGRDLAGSDPGQEMADLPLEWRPPTILVFRTSRLVGPPVSGPDHGATIVDSALQGRCGSKERTS